MLGQFNIARALYPLDDRRMRDFTHNVGRINGLAERSPGFVWRLEDEEAPEAPDLSDDPLMTWTLSVWRDLDSIRHFTWNTLHKRFRLRRGEWFEPLGRPYLAIWPIADDHRPDGAEALAMLDKLTREGPSDAVFGTEALAPMEGVTP
ncbi:DUF3291 domain-containing protein [Rhodobacterales bacterium HKCCE3408]|nr:DUF3291 domain-containing protein [Rhodobacterales bacterium HKCCE3408]